MHPLKYWRLIRYWVCQNNDLKQADLELLIYLYDEDYFTKEDFKTGTLLCSWDDNRFHRLMKEGWLKRTHNGSGRLGGHSKYITTPKTKKLVKTIYKTISGERHIPEDIRMNKIMKKSKYTDKLYSLAIKAFNKREE